jgi:hypothetical protein
VVVIGLFKTQLCLVVMLWLNWKLDGALRWKGEDRRLERLESGVWKAGTFKVVAPTYVG